MSTKQLPAELILSVLEALYYDVNHIPDHTTLRTCSLVCHSWRFPSQALLFRSLTILRRMDFDRLVVSLACNLSLGPQVRTLHLVIGKDGVDPSALSCILPLTPRLYELSLAATGVIEFSAGIVDKLRAVAQGSNPIVIRSLVLSRTSVQSRVLYQILQVWPTIQFLRLESELAASPPSIRPSFRLYELVLARIPSDENVSWLLADNDSALRILELKDDPSTALKTTLDDQAKFIRSLRLARYNTRSAPLLTQCSNLEELFLWTLPTVTQMRDIPKTIEHFGFHGLPRMRYGTSKTPFPNINIIASLPMLRTMSCHDSGTEELLLAIVAWDVKVNFRRMLPFSVVRTTCLLHRQVEFFSNTESLD
jgi:hypothetical protein